MHKRVFLYKALQYLSLSFTAAIRAKCLEEVMTVRHQERAPALKEGEEEKEREREGREKKREGTQTHIRMVARQCFFGKPTDETTNGRTPSSYRKKERERGRGGERTRE